jgi:excisionase family DNA binding protein
MARLREEIRGKIADGTLTIADLDGLDVATPAEVAAVLRCDPRTIRARLEDGSIPGTRLGTDWRVPTRWLREALGASTAA